MNFFSLDDFLFPKMIFSNVKGGPEPHEKEINEILGSKREDRLGILFLNWYKYHFGSFLVTVSRMHFL